MYQPRSLFRLIEEMNHTLFLPHIQRPFVWTEDQMQKLFDSLMRNYPIQTFLFWRTKDEIKARKFMDYIDRETELSALYDKLVTAQGVPKTFVLDGQQRLQSLRAIFQGGVVSVTGDGAAKLQAYLDIAGGEEPQDGGLRFVLEFSAEPRPLPWYRVANLLGKDAQKNASDIAFAINDEFDPLITETKDERHARQRRVLVNAAQLVSLLREDRHFWVEELDGIANEFSYNNILEIFVRVNSGGTKLDSSDLMFAVMKSEQDDIEERVEDAVGTISSPGLSFTKEFVLKCLVVAHGKGPELTPEKFNADGGALLKAISDNWDRAEEAFKQLADFIVHDLHIFSDKVVRTYGSFIPLFDYLFHNPKPKETDRALMRGYHYKAQLFGWFSYQTDNVISALHTRVGKQLAQGFPIDAVKEYFAERKLPVQFSPETLNDVRLRFIILNLVYAERFGNSPFNVKCTENEPHVDHIYPRSKLRDKLGLPTSDINVIPNYRFLGASDNLRKRAEEPASYFQRLKDGGIDIAKHLLVEKYADNPAELAMTLAGYSAFRETRRDAIVEICTRVINPEVAKSSPVAAGG